MGARSGSRTRTNVSTGPRERAVRITDRQLRQCVGHCLANGRKPEYQRRDVVAQFLQQAIFHDREGGEMAGIGEHLTADLAALDAVAAEQRFRVRQPAADQHQLPGEIERILHAGVHALSAGGAVDMDGVANQEHAAGSIIGQPCGSLG